MSSGSNKEQTIGYKYHAAIHMVLCHGPIDYVKKINIDEDSTLIEGNYRAGSHTVVKENLFGGEKKRQDDPFSRHCIIYADRRQRAGGRVLFCGFKKGSGAHYI